MNFKKTLKFSSTKEAKAQSKLQNSQLLYGKILSQKAKTQPKQKQKTKLKNPKNIRFHVNI